MQRVYARWEVLGSTNDLRRQRGEEIARLSLIENRLWVIMSNIKDNAEGSRDKLWVLGMINRLSDDRRMLTGLTEDAIKQCMQAPEDSEYANRIKKQKGLADMAGQLLDIIRARREEISEGEITNRKAIQ